MLRKPENRVYDSVVEMLTFVLNHLQNEFVLGGFALELFEVVIEFFEFFTLEIAVVLDIVDGGKDIP